MDQLKKPKKIIEETKEARSHTFNHVSAASGASLEHVLLPLLATIPEKS